VQVCIVHTVMWFHSPNKKSEILKIYFDEITERPSSFIRAVFVFEVGLQAEIACEGSLRALQTCFCVSAMSSTVQFIYLHSVKKNPAA